MKVGLGKVDAALERLERAVKELLVDLTDLCGNVEVFHDAHVDKAHSGLVLLGRLEDDGPVPVVLVKGADSHVRVDGLRGLVDPRAESEEFENLLELFLFLFGVDDLDPEATPLVDDVVDAAAELVTARESFRVDVD